MSFGLIVVLIRDNPMTSHRPAEGLRIALGLSTGAGSLNIVLIGDALLLLTDEVTEIVDAEILERHLPVIQELQLPITIPQGGRNEFSINDGFCVSEATDSEIAKTLCQADRVLVF